LAGSVGETLSVGVAFARLAVEVIVLPGSTVFFDICFEICCVIWQAIKIRPRLKKMANLVNRFMIFFSLSSNHSAGMRVGLWPSLALCCVSLSFKR
jgi:hypothetical protein